MQPVQQGYHFPPQEPEPAYGYGGQQLMPAQQQWGQPQPGYELAYQTYAAADQGPAPFQSPPPHAHQQQAYGEVEPEYGDDYYEDEEPRRGRRWILIAVALVGAIGVGGALAYGYRSFVAPHSGRVPVVKADPNVKAKPDFRGGREFAGAERRPPVRIPDESAAQPDQAGSADERSGENLGPRVVKSIPIAPGSTAAAPEPAPAQAAVPGITLYRPPALPAPQAAGAPPPAAQPQAAPQPAPKAVQPPPAQPSRIALGSRPQPPAEPDEEAPAAPPPLKRSIAVPAAAPAAPRPPPAARSVSSGLGYVAVLSSQKSSMDALKIYADLQQRYPDVLGDKTPDVQEADLSARGLGTMYRLVVGPPGSHNAARGVCTQLKTAGYEGCWVKEY
jgi:hypothetical protein